MDSPATSEEQSSVRIARINAQQVILVTIITAIAGIAGALIQGKVASGKVEGLKKEITSSASENTDLREKVTSSTSKIESLQKDLEGPGASAVERDALYRLTANYIEADLRLTAGKRSLVPPSELSDTELNYRMLRRAVFLNMPVLRANGTILESTLQTLILRGRGWIEAQKSRIISEFPLIKATRLRWLEDVAIPQLQRIISGAGMATQSVPSAEVPLPREVWILNTPADEPKITVSNMEALSDEAELLKRTL